MFLRIVHGLGWICKQLWKAGEIGRWRGYGARFMFDPWPMLELKEWDKTPRNHKDGDGQGGSCCFFFWWKK